MKAVITADIINSTKKSNDFLKKIIQSIHDESNSLTKGDYQVEALEFWRGDSFQMLIKNPEDGVYIAFRIKTAINRILDQITETKRGQKIIADARISIGIGEAQGTTPITESNEEAFILSGRGLENLKKENKSLGIYTPWKEINNEFDTECYLIQWISNKWSHASVSVIYEKLLGKTEREIARLLNIKQSSVNERGESGCWSGIQKFINRYKEIIIQYHQKDN